MELDIEELKTEADSLGIIYHPKIGADKLQAKINEFYAAQETSSAELVEVVKANESEVKPTAQSKRLTKEEAIRQSKIAANKTQVVTIIDNDQRVNNQTTTCKANCSNEYFDLGQVELPLNMAVEVRQGHLNVLREVKIPQHIKDPKTSLSTVVMRARYSIIPQ